MIKANRKSRFDILSFSIILLIVYTFFGFIAKTTVFASAGLVYISFLLLSLLFSCNAVKYLNSNAVVDSLTLWWLPFLLYTMGGYLIGGNIETFCYWTICLLLLLIASRCDLYHKVSYKTIFVLGCISVLGIVIQIVFRNFYNQHIATLFLNVDHILYWEKNYGYSGLTYQLDTTAAPMMFALGSVLYFYNKRQQVRMYKLKKALMVLLFINGVFLTGKRTLSLITIIAPLFVYIVSQKEQRKRVMIFLTTVSIVLCLILAFVNNLEFFSQFRAFNRLVVTAQEIHSRIDFTTGRSELFAKAIDVFKEYPVFGAGVGNYIEMTNEYTDVHNTYLQVLCEQGSVGLIMFIIPILGCLVSTIKELRKQADKRYLQFSLFSQTVYIICSFSGNTNLNLFGYVMYFIAIAILVSCKKHRCMQVLNREKEYAIRTSL